MLRSNAKKTKTNYLHFLMIFYILTGTDKFKKLKYSNDSFQIILFLFNKTNGHQYIHQSKIVSIEGR